MWLILLVGILFIFIIIDILYRKWGLEEQSTVITGPRSWWRKGKALDIGGPTRDGVYVEGPWQKREPIEPENKEGPDGG